MIQTPADTGQLTSFSATQALTERYFRTDYNIIYNKKYKRRGASGIAKTYETNPPITKSNEWNQ